MLNNVHLKSLLIILVLIAYAGCGHSTLKKYEVPRYINDLTKIQDRDALNTFILIGDTQKTGWLERHLLFRESNDSIPPIMFRKIDSLKSIPAFILHLGDMVYDGASKSEWQAFDKYTEPIRSKKIPLIPILGNHEYFGDKDSSMKNLTRRFENLKPKTWRAFKFKGIGIILLNSNEGDLTENEWLEQESWYKKQLCIFNDDSTITNILIASHHPPYTNGTGFFFGDNKNIQNTFVAPLDTIPKANVFFSAHCHSYEHFDMNGKQFIVSGGGGGPRRKLDLVSGHKDITKGSERHKELRDFNFCVITILEDHIQVQAYRYNKKEEEWNDGDSFKVDKF